MKKERIALITEAGNNLGPKFAITLHQAGYKVILAAAPEIMYSLKKEIDDRIQLIGLNYSSSESFDELKSFIDSSYGKLDVLINNAEIANGFGQKIQQLDIEELRALYDQNLFAVMVLTKKVYPLLARSDQAKIVNISSALGKIEKMKDDAFCYAQYQMTGYATAKAALEMFTLTLNRELKATNIEVVSFDPVRLENSTHDSLLICNQVKKELLETISPKRTRMHA